MMKISFKRGNCHSWSGI